MQKIDYASNLCALSKEQQDHIESEKNDWYTAYCLLRDKNRSEIVRYLSTLKGKKLENMRSKLNDIREKKKVVR